MQKSKDFQHHLIYETIKFSQKRKVAATLKNSEREQAWTLLNKLCTEKMNDPEYPCRPDNCEDCPVYKVLQMLAKKNSDEED